MRREQDASLPGGPGKGDQEFRNVLSVLSKTNLVTEGGPTVSVRTIQTRIEEARIAFQNYELDRALVWVAQASRDFGEIVRQWENLVRDIEQRAKEDVSVVKWRRIQGFHNQKRPNIRNTKTAFQRLRDMVALLKEEREKQRPMHQAVASTVRNRLAHKTEPVAPEIAQVNASLPRGFLEAFKRAARHASPKAFRAEVVTQYFKVEARLEVASKPGKEDTFDTLVPFPETDRLYFLGQSARIVLMHRPAEGTVVQVHDPETGQNGSMILAEFRNHIQGGVWLLGAKT